MNLANLFNRTTRAMERRYLGKPATYTTRTYGTVDVDTGTQQITELSKPVVVKPYPISIGELLSLTQAGLTQIEARWAMRAHYVSAIEPGDRLQISGFTYEVLDRPPSVLDEFGVDWVIYTRRVRTSS